MDELDSLVLDTGSIGDTGRVRGVNDCDIVYRRRRILTLLFIVEPCEYQLVESGTYILQINTEVMPSFCSVEFLASVECNSTGGQVTSCLDGFCSRNEGYTQVVVDLFTVIVSVRLPLVGNMVRSRLVEVEQDICEGRGLNILVVGVVASVRRDIESVGSGACCAFTDHPCVRLVTVDEFPTGGCSLEVLIERNCSLLDVGSKGDRYYNAVVAFAACTTEIEYIFCTLAQSFKRY